MSDVTDRDAVAVPARQPFAGSFDGQSRFVLAAVGEVPARKH
jgi:hypothetical protein